MNQTSDTRFAITRRAVLETGTAAVALLSTGFPQGALAAGLPDADTAPAPLTVQLQVNGQPYAMRLDPRVTLLDALREHLGLTGTKKGCDQGQCGACTVILNGQRINSCLTLAVMHAGDAITTIEGLQRDGDLHPMQAAFVRHDGLQCGYCTPGQICSAVALLAEHKAGWPSYATADVATAPVLTDAEIAERMSGNICRCSAYPNIVSAIRDVAEGGRT
jgi:xanthine dehydrogenase YagT iron-sulfur-binding subunit